MVNQSRRMSPAQIQANRDAFAALQAITGYAPSNPAYALTAVTAASNGLAAAQQAETQAASGSGGTR